MQTAKRRWIYTGLALPSDVGLVRHSEIPSDLPKVELSSIRLALIGDELAEGLQTALSVLGEESGAFVDARPRRGSTVAAWLDGGWLAEVLEGMPSWVVAAFHWGVVSASRFAVPTGAMRVAQDEADRCGARIVWVAHPGVLPDALREVRENVVGNRHGVLSSQGLHIQVGPDGTDPTALGYAGWAGAVWKQIESGAANG